MKKLIPALLVCCLAAAAQLQTLRAQTGEWTNLLDRRLTKWELWMGVPHSTVTGLPPGTFQSDNIKSGTPLGLDNDPKKVFSVIKENDQPVLKITGEIYGGLTTLLEYSNYQFSCEVKFGPKKWEPRLTKPRDSGLLYHCTGPHGAFWRVWKACVEFQVIEGGMADLYLLGGPGGDVRVKSEQNRTFDPTSQIISSKPPIQRSADFENPTGQWNTLELYTLGRQAIHVVNGQVVMAVDNIRIGANNTPLSKGQIQIQSEGAETYYRNIKIRAITAFPAAIKQQAGF